MSGLQKRLEKLEETMNPSGRVAIIFVRPGHKEEDSAKQKEEYFARWGQSRNLTFLTITEWCDFDYDYETFIHKMRGKCPPGNCFTDWWIRSK